MREPTYLQAFGYKVGDKAKLQNAADPRNVIPVLELVLNFGVSERLNRLTTSGNRKK